MKREYPKNDPIKMDRLDQLVDNITTSLPWDIWGDCLCRMSEYLAQGEDSESALDNTYYDMIDSMDIEGMDQFTEEDIELIKTHLHFLMAQDNNPGLFSL